MVSLLVVIGAVLIYRVQRHKIISRTYYELNLITSLKSEELRKWRLEHLRDAFIIQNMSVLNGLLRQFLRKSDEGKKKEICQRLELFVENYDYHSVLLTDTRGVVKLKYPDSPAVGEVNKLDATVFNRRDVDLSDLHFSDDMPGIHMDLSIPVTKAGDTVVTGMIIMRIDPEITLFPTINAGPPRGLSSETILLRLKDDSVTYLNRTLSHPVHHRFYKRSLDKKHLIAGLKILGNEGRFEGLDYRNITVLSFMKRIPGSPWLIVSKIDKEEALSSLYQHTILTSIIIFLLLTTLIITLFYLWRSQSTRFYRELSATKDKFVSIMTHDLTNPFVSIIGFCDIMIEDLRKKNYLNVEKYAGIIHDSSLSAVDLLKNLAQWSKVQTNRIRMNPSRINLTLLIDQAISVMKAFADRKSVSVLRDTPPEFWIEADSEMMSTILRNLVNNAIKYSITGGTIVIRALIYRNEARVEVIDSGVGVDDEILKKIFTSEEVITMPGTMAETGTGLGLRLCREFVSRHRGSIWAESEPGKGSMFVFTVPLSVSEPR